MGPFPHDAPPAEITKENPAGTDGFEFVEYAHDEPEKLEALFTKMGYTPVAKHKTKNITVWRQGDINYILNGEKDSFGGRFVEAHGPCAPSMATNQSMHQRFWALADLCFISLRNMVTKVQPMKLNLSGSVKPTHALKVLVFIISTT